MIKRPLTEIKLEIDDVEKFKSFISDYEQKTNMKATKTSALLEASMDNLCNDDAAFSPLGSALFNKELIRGATVTQLMGGPHTSESSSINRGFLDFTFARGITTPVGEPSGSGVPSHDLPQVSSTSEIGSRQMGVSEVRRRLGFSPEVIRNSSGGSSHQLNSSGTASTGCANTAAQANITHYR